MLLTIHLRSKIEAEIMSDFLDAVDMMMAIVSSFSDRGFLFY